MQRAKASEVTFGDGTWYHERVAAGLVA